MITIPKKLNSEVKKFRELAFKRQKEEDRQFNALCKKLGVKPDSEKAMCLFDYIYNDVTWSVRFE